MLEGPIIGSSALKPCCATIPIVGTVSGSGSGRKRVYESDVCQDTEVRLGVQQ